MLRSRKVQDCLLIAVLTLVGLLSFGMGRLSAQTPTRTANTAPLLCSGNQYTELVASPVGAIKTDNERPETDKSAQSNSPAALSGKYVASKTGSVYHLPWCAGAKRIKEENKIWFASKEEAERAGLRPASNCKGI